MVKTLHDMFVLGLPVAEKVLRPITVYFFLIAGLRVAGKRELAQLNPLDLVVLLTLSNTVQNAIIGDDNSVTGGIIGATTLLVINAVVTRFLYRHPRLEQKLEGEPITLIRDGKVLPQNLRHELVTEAELRAAVRRQGIESLENVELALLETNGTVSVFTKHPTPPEAMEQDITNQLVEI